MKELHSIRVEQATAEGKTNVQKIDVTYRLGYHLMAPSGWINDPNGLIQYNGLYHVFYQHHPYGSTWGPMHWGHAISKDLVHWEHLPVALAPGDTFDRDGCFSGSAVDNNGVLTLIYTGHLHDQISGAVKQNQNLATSEDGRVFHKYSQNPVIKAPPPGAAHDFRDPKVWKHKETWYMVVGSRSEQTNRGQVLLYYSADLTQWTYHSVLAQSNGSEGYMWECPDFFELDGQFILLLSPQGIETRGNRYANLFQTGYVVGSFDYETLIFTHGEFIELDYGHDFYAVQTLLDQRGRRIAFGWMDMWESAMPTQEHGWAGALTLPRQLSLTEQGRILMKPVEEHKILRQMEVKEQPPERLTKGDHLLSLSGEMIELKLHFVNVAEAEFGVKLRCSKDGKEETRLTFYAKQNKLVLDRSNSGHAVSERRVGFIRCCDELHLQIFVDRSSIEVFANDGELVLSSRIYPSVGSDLVKLFVESGQVQLRAMNQYVLKEILR